MLVFTHTLYKFFIGSSVEYTYNVVLQNGSAQDVDFVQVKCTTNVECSANFLISSSYMHYRIIIAAVDNQRMTVGLPYTSELIGKYNCKSSFIGIL